MKQLLVRLTVLIALTLFRSYAGTIEVSANANIFGAGHTAPPHLGSGGSGTLPPSCSFSPGPRKILSFIGVTGMCTLTAGLGLHGPEGYPLPTDVNSTGGISGIRHDRDGFLVGVFLGPDEPAAPAPPRLDFRMAALESNSSAITPQIGQVFYIGNQSTIGKQYPIPATATRLFLGFADAYEYTGDPGQYQDNEGSLTATFEIIHNHRGRNGPALDSIAIKSAPEIQVFPAVELRWGSESNKLYQVQWTLSLDQPQWINLGPQIAPTSPDISVFDSTRERQQGFYRILVLQ